MCVGCVLIGDDEILDSLNRLERTASRGNAIEVLGDRALKSLQPDREAGQSLLRNCSPTESVQDLFAAAWADGGYHGSIFHRKLLPQERDVQDDRAAGRIGIQHVIAIDIENTLCDCQ